MLHRWQRCERKRGPGSGRGGAREALAIIRKQFGDDHAATATEVHDLAYVIGKIPGREVEAERLFREALQVRRRVQGLGDAAAVDTAFRLAQVLGEQQKFEEAETLLQESYAALAANRASGPAQAFEPILLQWIIEQYRNWGKPEQAAQWERRQSTVKSNDP
jgi:hypothetical protein